MGNHSEDRIFTKKGVAIGALLFCIYGVILFSMDPEWVRWAGGMLIMGALYVPDPPPPLFADPQEAVRAVSPFNLLSLTALTFLIAFRRGLRFGWLPRLETRLKKKKGSKLFKPFYSLAILGVRLFAKFIQSLDLL